MTAKASNHKDTYRATAVFLGIMGLLYLLDRLIGFAAHGLPWVMQNIGLVVSLLGQMSGYLLPVALLLIGILLYWLSSR